MDRLTSMAVFVAAVDRGGFAAVADQFGMSATMVGLHVKSLEDRLGARLLNRTTRRQSLTEVGRLFHERCKTILADVDVAEASALELQAAPRGRLRVAAPVSFGVHGLTPVLTDYLAMHPEVEIDLVLNDRVADLVDEGFEVAIRIGKLSSSSLICVPIAPYRMIISASPSYIDKMGCPDSPASLKQHNCLGFTYWKTRNEWRFSGQSGDANVQVHGNFQVNNGEALRIAACAGLGIIMQPEVLLRDDIANGRLEQLFDDGLIPPRPMHVLYLPGKRPTPKVRTFIDFLVERFGHRRDL